MAKLAAAQEPVSAWSGQGDATDGRAELLRAAIRKLPRRCREVVMLVRFNYLTHAEAASVLGIASKTVEIHLSRAIKILRDSLK
jgi:RNA polymerase sigma factor (sigma-70 family)